MKVLAGRLTDAQRRILFESYDTGRRVLVATLTAYVEYNQNGACGPQVPMQAVGHVMTWDHDSFKLGSWSFVTRIPWADAVGVWWRDEAPSQEDVDALIAEFVAQHPDSEEQS